MGYAEIIVPKPCNSNGNGLYCRCTRNVITHQESECNEEMKTVMLNTTNDIVNGDVATVEQTKETKTRQKRGNPYLRGNTWSFDYCTYDIDGSKKRHTKGGYKTKEEAEIELREMQAKADLGMIPNKSQKLEEYLLDWYGRMQHTVAGSTAADYYNHIVNHINPYIGKIKLTELNAAHLSALYKKLHTQGYAPRTINLVHCVIRSALRSAYDLELVNRNVATSKEVWKPKILKHEAHLYSVPQVKELLQVFESCPADDPKKIYADCLTVVLSLGVRRGEGLGLKFKDFDLTANKVYINTQVAPARTEEDTAIAANPTDNGLPKPKTQVQLTGLKTQSAYRWINVPEPIIDIVKKRMLIVQKQKQIYGSAYEDNDLVFCKANGHWLQPNQLNTNYNTFVAMTGLKYSTPHDLRHSYATNLLDADMPIKVISSNLGHSTVKITMDIYADSIVKKEQSAQVVSDLYFK